MNSIDINSSTYIDFDVKNNDKDYKVKAGDHVIISKHKHIFSSFVNNGTFVQGSGVQKFNNSLLFNTEFVEKLKILIETIKSNLQKNVSFSDHSKWKFLK